MCKGCAGLLESLLRFVLHWRRARTRCEQAGARENTFENACCTPVHWIQVTRLLTRCAGTMVEGAQAFKVVKRPPLAREAGTATWTDTSKCQQCSAAFYSCCMRTPSKNRSKTAIGSRAAFCAYMHVSTARRPAYNVLVRFKTPESVLHTSENVSPKRFFQKRDSLFQTGASCGAMLLAWCAGSGAQRVAAWPRAAASKQAGLRCALPSSPSMKHPC